MPKQTGRPKKPDHLKVVQGTARPDRVNSEQPLPDGELGDPPDRMPELAQRLWREIAPEIWWLTAADRSTFERYCRHFALYLWCCEEVEREGPVQTFKSGAQNASGAMIALHKSEVAMDKIGAGLGLDPASRSKIKAGERPVDSPWKKFREG